MRSHHIENTPWKHRFFIQQMGLNVLNGDICVHPLVFLQELKNLGREYSYFLISNVTNNK